jgi:hypothetical protein
MKDRLTPADANARYIARTAPAIATARDAIIRATR